MDDARGFCLAVLHEYERQWGRGGGHAVRHPLRLKMERLKRWSELATSPDELERLLELGRTSADPGDVLLADELLPLWRAMRATGHVPFGTRAARASLDPPP